MRLVKASTKLVPSKTILVPELELNAALLAARQASYIQKALVRPLDGRYFWTDSSTVRHWIRATAAYYQSFVRS